MYYLYKIISQINNKCYIGITNNPTIRWYKHKTSKTRTLISRAIQKYGPENFEFKLLVVGEESYIKELEIKAIAAFNTKAPNGYNLTDGGEGSLGLSPSVATREKQRRSMRGKCHSLETKEKIRQSHFGVRPTITQWMVRWRKTGKMPKGIKICRKPGSVRTPISIMLPSCNILAARSLVLKITTTRLLAQSTSM